MLKSLKAHEITESNESTESTCTLSQPLQDISKTLTSLEESTDYTQEHDIVTSGYVVPYVIVLKAALNNMHSSYKIDPVTALKKYVKNRLT